MTRCNCCGGSESVSLFEANCHTLVRCSTCDLHFVDPMPDPDARMVDVKAGRYGAGLQVIDAEKQLAAERTRLREFQGYVDLAHGYSPGGRLLDVGCGSGFLMTIARRAGYAPEGIEMTADRYAVAARTGWAVHDRPVEELAFPDNTFSATTLINVFSHLADPAGTLAEVARILRPGGVLVMVTGEIRGTVSKRHLPEWTLGDELFFLGTRTLSEYADRTGLQVVSRRVTWLPDALYSRASFQVRGRSRRRNAIKTTFLVVPGALSVLRSAMRRRQADNPIHSGVYVLRKPSSGTTEAGL